MSTTVRILRIITRLNIGGPSVHVALLAQQLAPPAYETVLVSGRPAPGEGDMGHLLRGSGVRHVQARSLVRAVRPWRDLAAWWQLVRLLWQEQPDVVHTHMAKAGGVGRLAGLAYNRWGPGRTPGRRAVLLHTFHGHVLEGYFSTWTASLFVRIERWLARRTDCLIAVSPAIRDALLAKGIGRPEQWRVVRLGLDLAGLAGLPLPEPQAPVRFGIVGRLVPIKNPALFLEAVRQASQRRRDPVYAVVVGDGPLRTPLEAEACRLGLKRQVRFTGWQDDLRAVYGGLDAACVTSWNEGTPVALIEAMAAGRAVVATDVGGVRDLLEEEGAPTGPVPQGGFRVTARGILVRPGDAEGYSAALVALADDPQLRRRLGLAARTSVVTRYAHERLAAEMRQLYQRLLQGRTT